MENRVRADGFKEALEGGRSQIDADYLSAIECPAWFAEIEAHHMFHSIGFFEFPHQFGASIVCDTSHQDSATFLFGCHKSPSSPGAGFDQNESESEPRSESCTQPN